MATAKTETKKDGEKIAALFVRSRGESFRRCGFRFTADGFAVDAGEFNREQLKALKEERNLFVEEVEVDPAECVEPE